MGKSAKNVEATGGVDGAGARRWLTPLPQRFLAVPVIDIYSSLLYIFPLDLELTTGSLAALNACGVEEVATAPRSPPSLGSPSPHPTMKYSYPLGPQVYFPQSTPL